MLSMLVAGRSIAKRALATSAAAAASKPRVGFVGLGAMGYPMAANLFLNSSNFRPSTAFGDRAEEEVASNQNSSDFTCVVYDRSASRALRHAAEYGTRAAGSLDELADCSVVFLSLPTSREVDSVCRDLALAPGAIVADCTSGDPRVTRQVAARLAERRVGLVDCPVSGGPAGAESGQLTSMVGGGEEAVAAVEPYLRRMAQKGVVHVGSVGAGHAVKAVNNTLNAAHLAVAAEGLLALAEFGVAPERALAAINGSSGRSLQTEVRLPKEVLTRDFAYGFPLRLMLKDVGIAVNGVCGATLDVPGSKFFPLVQDLLRRAAALEPADADYSRVVRPLEAAAGRELHAGGGQGTYAAPKYVPTCKEAPGEDTAREATRVWDTSKKVLHLHNWADHVRGSMARPRAFAYWPAM